MHSVSCTRTEGSMQHHTRHQSAHGQSRSSSRASTTEDPQEHQITHIRIGGTWTGVSRRGTLARQDRKGTLTASDVQQEPTTVCSRAEDVGAHLQQPQKGVIVRTQAVTEEIKRRMFHTKIAGSQHKAVDEDDHQLPLMHVIPTSMISDRRMSRITPSVASAGGHMDA